METGVIQIACVELRAAQDSSLLFFNPPVNTHHSNPFNTRSIFPSTVYRVRFGGFKSAVDLMRLSVGLLRYRRYEAMLFTNEVTPDTTNNSISISAMYLAGTPFGYILICPH